MDPITLIGVTGGAIVLLAFFMNQTGKWKNDDFIYDFVNTLGSGILIVYAILINSLPFLILNSIWALVSLKDIAIFIFKKHD